MGAVGRVTRDRQRGCEGPIQSCARTVEKNCELSLKKKSRFQVARMIDADGSRHQFYDIPAIHSRLLLTRRSVTIHFNAFQVRNKIKIQALAFADLVWVAA